MPASGYDRVLISYQRQETAVWPADCMIDSWPGSATTKCYGHRPNRAWIDFAEVITHAIATSLGAVGVIGFAQGQRH